MRSFFRNSCILVLVAAAALAPAGCGKRPPAPGAEALKEKKIVVARVNGTDITRYALINMMIRMSAINRGASPSESREEAGKRALDNLIFRELALQEATRQGLSVEEQRVDDAMRQFITSVGHEEGYRNLLEQQQVTPAEVRSQVEQSLLLQLVTAREVAAKAGVTDDEAREEYERGKDRFITPEKVSVVDVALSPKPDEEASIKKANELLANLNADKNKNPRELVSDGTFTVSSLDLKKEKEPALYDAARKLKQGELSSVIKAGDGLHIIQLTQYAPGKQLSYEEVKGPLKEQLRAIAQVKRFAEWEQELKKGAKIEIMDVPLPRELKKP